MATEIPKLLGSESIFMDSGAFSLYAINVAKSQGQEMMEGFDVVLKKRREGKAFAEFLKKDKLDPPPRRARGDDYSYYSLSKGSEFRAYCDIYAKFMKLFAGRDITFATVDAIRNEELSWDIQKYFEEEHGLYPMPIVHGGTAARYLHRYLEEPKKYPLIGFGGLAGGVRPFIKWVDESFADVCPKSNNYLPLVKVHGFAVTSWEYMIRWPWWSVDSTSWIKYAAYGWILVPPFSKGSFRYDLPPLQLNMSRKPTPRMHRSIRNKGKSPRQQRDNHYDNTTKFVKEQTDRWLAHLKIPMGAFEKEEIVEEGVSSSFQARAIVNLHYFKNLEESMPPWPVPLNRELIQEGSVQYHRGFGL